MQAKEKIEKEEINVPENTLSDLSVTDEQAIKTTGGDSFSMNFKVIKVEYREQKPDGGL